MASFVFRAWAKGPRRVEDEARRTLAQIMGGAVVLMGLYFTWRNVSVVQEGQITERFTRAIDQLGAINEKGEKKLEIRLGGIYALERIARDSEKDYWPIMEILTAYVRERSPRKKEGSPPHKGQSREKNQLPPPKLDADIQAILTVIGRRAQTFEEERHRLDLHATDLRGANLFGANLTGVNLREADLAAADLFQANLYKAYLPGAVLRRAVLGANLIKADLTKADLAGANLIFADLTEANLTEANLAEAFLFRANLTRANLTEANLTEATLFWANLSEVNLREARNWTKARIEWTIVNEKTLFPVDLKASVQPKATQKED